MLETAEGIENCEAVSAVDGIDVLLIGSGDLTTDLGIPGQVDHPRLRAAYERVAAACRMHNKVLGVGGIRHNTGLRGELIRLGARFVIAGTDTNYVLAGARPGRQVAVALTTPSIGGVAPRKGACRRKIEMSPCAQSRDDTPLGADTTSATLDRIGIELRWSVTGEAEAGSAGEQPAEE
jgi:hypothetical protein